MVNIFKKLLAAKGKHSEGGRSSKKISLTKKTKTKVPAAETDSPFVASKLKTSRNFRMLAGRNPTLNRL